MTMLIDGVKPLAFEEAYYHNPETVIKSRHLPIDQDLVRGEECPACNGIAHLVQSVPYVDDYNRVPSGAIVCTQDGTVMDIFVCLSCEQILAARVFPCGSHLLLETELLNH